MWKKNVERVYFFGSCLLGYISIPIRPYPIIFLYIPCISIHIHPVRPDPFISIHIDPYPFISIFMSRGKCVFQKLQKRKLNGPRGPLSFLFCNFWKTHLRRPSNIHIYAHTHKNIYTHTRIYAYMHWGITDSYATIHIYSHAYRYRYTFIHMYPPIRKYVQILKYIHTYTHTCTYIHICTHISTYTKKICLYMNM